MRKTTSCKETRESPGCFSSLIGLKNFFWPIRSRQFKRFWNWFGKSKCPGASLDLTVNFHHEHCIVPTDCSWVSEDALRGCLHDTGATFAPRRVHSGSLSWLYIYLHDTTTNSHAGASRLGVSSLRLSHRGENFTPVRNLATVSCKHETTTRFGVKSV